MLCCYSLEGKMLEEMHDDALAISHKFPVTGWIPMKTVHNHEGEDVTTGTLFMYNIGEQREQREQRSSGTARRDRE
jgi:hypothetical protein